MEIKNDNYWTNKKENFEKKKLFNKDEEEKFININNNDGERIKTIIGIILICSVIIIGIIHTIVQNEKEEKIKKINERIIRYNQEHLYKNQIAIEENQKQLLNQYYNINNNKNNNYDNLNNIENQQNTIKTYTRFNGRILNYSKNNGIVTIAIMTNSYKIENVRTTENVIQNIQNKIDNNNNFEFTCQTKRGNILEECSIY